MKLLNIACGERYHDEWINIDFHSNSSKVKKVNLLNKLPFENDTFDVVYCSHFIEHLTKDQSLFVLEEMIRVLKSEGILRIVVPDLENICREYLKILDTVEESIDAQMKYEWIIIELLDQLVRTNSGGEMLKLFDELSKNNNQELTEYIQNRIGKTYHAKQQVPFIEKISFNNIKNKLLYMYLQIVSYLIPRKIRELIFINTGIGERHQWLYDKYSMKRLLKKIGFNNITSESYNTSRIPNFNEYYLDVNIDQSSYKGLSSLYIEANK